MRLRDEAGFSLTELLVAMSLMIVILSATLTTLDTFAKSNDRNLKVNDMRESARMGIDALAADLRNAGGGQQAPVERAEPTDLVFDDIDPSGGGFSGSSVRRVRYCLEETTAKTGKLWRQEQAWSATLPAATDCPSADFGSQKLIADGVVNHTAESGDRPIFSYDATDLVQLTTIGVDLFVDPDVDREPPTADLGTSVRIRNRNRPPTAAFTATPQGHRHVLLNAGGSSDPEGQQLKYNWYCDGSPCPSWVNGQVVDYQAATIGAHTFGLTVTDPGDLTSEMVSQTVVVLP
jgi:type II secretory pathway component PulJ